jgi:DNA invertase Pin-like site-specific DNA recombinase
MKQQTTGRALGYARVSTSGQTCDQQIDALRAAGCVDVYCDDGISGSTTSRPELDRLMSELRAGDTLIVKRLDRLGRSTAHLTSTVEDLGRRGITFRSLDEGLATDTASAKLVFAIFAALAAFEKDLLAERTRDALAAKKRRGEKLGRRAVLKPSQVAAAQKMVADGEAPSHVAHLFGVDRTTLWRALKRSDAAALKTAS